MMRKGKNKKFQRKADIRDEIEVKIYKQINDKQITARKKGGKMKFQTGRGKLFSNADVIL
jgi:hypothetical protein